MQEYSMVDDQGTAPARDRGGVGQDRLASALELCRLELAQLHERQEEWMEQASLLPKAIATRNAFAQGLATRLSSDYWMQQRPGRCLPGGMRGRLARWILEFGGSQNPEWPLVELIEGSPYFDAAWYLAEYPDVLEAGYSPAEHYLHHGAAEGRDPGPNFSTAYYLRNAPDIAEAGMNPLVHFAQYGKAEGRLPSAIDS
jgi:hypothetical protein